MGRILAHEYAAVLVEDAALLDNSGHGVGRGTVVLGALWDGDSVVGCLCVDNLLSGRGLSEGDRVVTRALSQPENQ